MKVVKTLPRIFAADLLREMLADSVVALIDGPELIDGADPPGDRVQGAHHPRVQLHGLLTRFRNAPGGIDHVVNDTGAAVTAASPGPRDVVSYP